MTAAQRSRLERRRSHLLAIGAQPDRKGTAFDQELARLQAVLNRGRTKQARAGHATSPITRRSTSGSPLFNVSDVGGYYR